MEKKTWEEAIKLVKVIYADQDISEEQIKALAEKIMKHEEQIETFAKKIVESDDVKSAEVSENIAKGEVVEDEEVIGSGIIADPQEEKRQEKEENDFIIRFQRPYHFEGKSYAGVDLSGLRSLRAKDVWKINRNYRNAGNISLLQEMDSEYTARVAARASGMPVEFFEGMELPDMIKVRTKVSDFFYPRE